MRLRLALIVIAGSVVPACGGGDARDPSAAATALPPMNSALWVAFDSGELDSLTEWELAQHRVTERRCERFLVFPKGDPDPGSVRSPSYGLTGCSDDGGPVFDDPGRDVACSFLMQVEAGPMTRWPFSRSQLTQDPCADFDFNGLSLRTRRAGVLRG